MCSKIIPEQNNIPEEDWQNHSLAILGKHCTTFLPVVVCTICSLLCIPEILTHLRLSLDRKGMVQTVYETWGAGERKSLLTLSFTKSVLFSFMVTSSST